MPRLNATWPLSTPIGAVRRGAIVHARLTTKPTPKMAELPEPVTRELTAPIDRVRRVRDTTSAAVGMTATCAGSPVTTTTASNASIGVSRGRSSIPCAADTSVALRDGNEHEVTRRFHDLADGDVWSRQVHARRGAAGAALGWRASRRAPRWR